MTASKLAEIALGAASLDAARRAIDEALRDASAQTARSIYGALRAWVWKALDGRRRDDELREWFDLLRRVSGALSERHSGVAERVAALHDLIYESISTSEVLTPVEVLRRQHVRDVLSLVLSAGGKMDRSRIVDALDLKQANVTRILNMMTLARLMERTVYGRNAIFQLTKLGEAAASDLKPSTAPRQARIATEDLKGYLKSHPQVRMNWAVMRVLQHTPAVASLFDDMRAEEEGLLDAEEIGKALQRKVLNETGVHAVSQQTMSYYETIGTSKGALLAEMKRHKRRAPPPTRDLNPFLSRKKNFTAALASGNEKEKIESVAG